MSLTKGLASPLILFYHEMTSSPVTITMSNVPAGPAPPAPQPSTKITEIHIGCPDEYNRKAETAQAWLDSVRLYILINQVLYHDDNRKITYALSYMKKGSAATWAKVCRQQGFTNQSFRMFNTFEQGFKKAFGNVNTTQEAMNWLSRTAPGLYQQIHTQCHPCQVRRDQRHCYLDLLLLNWNPDLDYASHPSHGHHPYHHYWMVRQSCPLPPSEGNCSKGGPHASGDHSTNFATRKCLPPANVSPDSRPKCHGY